MSKSCDIAQRLHNELPGALPSVRRFAYILTGDAGDADAVVLRAIERASRRSAGPRAHETMDQWIIRHAVKCWAAQKPKPTLCIAQSANHSSDPAMSTIRRIIREMPERRRMIVALVLANEASNLQAAAVLGLSTIAIMEDLSAARKQLITAIHPLFPECEEALGDDDFMRYVDGELTSSNMLLAGSFMSADRRLVAFRNIARSLPNLIREAHYPGPTQETFEARFIINRTRPQASRSASIFGAVFAPGRWLL